MNASQLAAAKTPMGKAFATVRGALSRNEPVELRCKRIWLERVIRDLPDSVFSNEAEIGLRLVNAALAKLTA